MSRLLLQQEWSRRDPLSCGASACKWNLSRPAAPVAAGTAFKMALDTAASGERPGHVDWEDTINTRDGGGTIVDRTWLRQEVQEPTDWHPRERPHYLFDGFSLTHPNTSGM